MSTRDTLLVLVNRKSGGQRGEQILAEFQAALPSAQVIDMIASGPLDGLRLALTLNPAPSLARVIVAGGDGTVDWALAVMEAELDRDDRARIALAHLPLGTGNDMARATGWGGGYDGGKTEEVIESVLKADPIPLDRWAVTFRKGSGDEETKVFANYFSVGADAAVAYNFHHLREEKPHLFKTRAINKIWYGTSGLKAQLRGQTYHLRRDTVIEVDGKALPIPRGIRTVLLLNIPSYMGGADVWKKDQETVGCMGSPVEYSRQSPGDGMVELVGFGGPFHQGLVRAFKGRGRRLAQGTSVTIRTQNDHGFAQVDGEPWQLDSTYDAEVVSRGRATMLVKTK